MSSADTLLEQITEELRATESVEAVWLSGSRGRGTNDEFSDIDIWVAIQDDAMPPVAKDPLSFVRNLVPTIMDINAPSIAPKGGAFFGCWVPVEGEFVQIDWYITPASSAVRDADTVKVFGEVSVGETDPPEADTLETNPAKTHEYLTFTLQMIGNMVKHARRGNLWRVAEHAKHADRCLITARSFHSTGAEPDFVSLQRSYLQAPPPTSAAEVQHLALDVLEQASDLIKVAEVDLDEAVAALRQQILNWCNTGWKPTEEYYRTLPRRYMGAGVLITDPDKNILILETTYKQFHEIPGGVCEAGESPRAAAEREVQEELGIKLRPGKLLVMDSRNQPPPKGDAVMFVYDGGVVENPSIFQPDEREIARVKFVPLDEVDRYCTPQMPLRLRTAMLARDQDRLIEIANGKVVN